MADQFKACSVEGCNRNAHRSEHGANGFCSPHYQRQRTHGDPLAGRTPDGEPSAFLSGVVLTYQGTDCLIWPYSRNKQGYGKIVVDGRRVLVHRYVCMLVNERPPTPKHEAAHSCGNGYLGCVAPSHLSWKTGKENVADTLVHGTRSRGERNGQSKLTEDQAREILQLRGTIPPQVLADRFGVSRSTVNLIQKRINWAWL